ncbi:hypothetical protein DICPUDRAFT_38806 [Dictyostelium purpureum]|uniref:Poly A polymerase head domain-containing protein n=1 Tax=Dictyostelium purpureum TaxID=5786 RepID=F0ZVA3_DICPU|nr:uncharacterized protein DICPUDRAFT_38806 [Dictyostelium purpureum]EGC32133.1 hypothetical protein DICPUDRAFT_38806 [Dictyostelium purpureum]|eukprot:XP_003291342.1 hypothetical protein DICPUDRAFT_38806 [Dictyostelium purpureum]
MDNVVNSEKKLKNKLAIPITTIKQDHNNYDKCYFHKASSTTENEIDNDYFKINVGIDSNNGEIKSTEIHLTKSEVLLFQELMHVVRNSNCGTTLRVAGGWVRDKLRGDDSNDIDITLDNMMGESFAELVNKHLSGKQHQTHRIGVIQSNPEQSKHLETATVKIFDLWIDFVNLRSETYTDNSRIPEIKIGTPLEDSLRRDLTINSLFYNINENKIEDFTGKAITDLNLGIIRTPLPPLTTFLDDPLRVFRSIRFASRLYFKIDQELVEAASNAVVKEAIKSKISHERIAKEFDGMLGGKRPDLAISLIYRFGIYDCLFSLPTSGLDHTKVHTEYREQSIYYCSQAMRLIEWGSQDEELSTKRQRLLSALCIPFYGITYLNANKKNKETSVIHYMIIEYLKLSNKDNDEISLVLDTAYQIRPHVLKYKEEGPSSFSRKNVGLIIHKCGVLWRAALAIALILDLPKYNFNHFNFPTLCDESNLIINHYNLFCDEIKEQDLIGIWKIKRMLNGKQVQDLLNRKPGEWLAPVVQSILEWQLENPTLNENDCKKWLLETFK